MRLAVASLLLALPATLASAQHFSTEACHDGTLSAGGWFSHQERACEIRRTTLPLLNGHLALSGKNGGVEVIGEDRSDIALEARVTAQGASRGDAESTLREIRILTSGEIHADGPNNSSWSHSEWSVSYKLRVPRRLASAQIHTMNGGISLANLNGILHADTTNGGLVLTDLSGDVHAETVNGGVDVRLTGDRWQGAGLSARSTNGGISVRTSGHYGAHVVAQTVNGGVSVPGAAPEGRRHNHLDTEIGGGGPTLHFETVNGGVAMAML
jgi:hypothetical protein